MLRAGVATAIVTPPVGVALAGYGDRPGPATGVHDDLEARVLVLRDGDVAAALVCLDLLALTPDVADAVRAAVAGAADVPTAAVVTSCTHTHAAPSTLTGAEAIGWPVPEGYVDLLASRAAAAALSAAATAGPVGARFARGPLGPGVCVDRRGHPHAPTVAVLELRGPGGPVATVANLGIHPTVSGPANRSVATDWVGPFRAALEERLGGTALFLQGCQGDVNPAVEWERGDPTGWIPAARALGRELADRAVAVLDAATDAGASLWVAPTRWAVASVGDTLLAALDGSAGPRRAPLMELHVGDVTLLTVPGEAFTVVEQEVLAARGGRVLIAGLAPEWHGYLPRPYGDGYEESLSFGPDFTDAVLAELVAGPPG